MPSCGGPTSTERSKSSLSKQEPRRSPPPDEEERGTVPDPIPQSESEPGVEEAGEDVSARRRVAPRVVTNFSEEEKEIVIDFLQQNPTLYSKRLAGYKDTAAKGRLWAEQARQMNRTPSELKTWYESMRTKLGKLKKAVTKSGQAADRFTATECGKNLDCQSEKKPVKHFKFWQICQTQYFLYLSHIQALAILILYDGLLSVIDQSIDRSIDR